ncbi:Uu.00g018070.m01.CDS01 [Anthostomella pinea]|uniref:Uu.00g018070.m01.CDS01 n=1 Tax=Anthostomella pinea TaxID=933095 RepID=A0AAI8VZ12_9PEZI|nr:Uu.00g018070.m01.CDS01 [Anthostomella pinea]
MSSDANYGSKRSSANGNSQATMPAHAAASIPAHYLATQVAPHHELMANMSGIHTQGPVDAGMNAVVNQFGGLGINGAAVGHHGAMPGMASPYMTMPDGQLVYGGYAPAGAHPFAYGQGHDPNNPAFTTPYLAQGNYPAYMPYPVFPYTPGRTGSMPERTDASAKDVPALDNRRSSYSTHSTNESTPATPFFGSMAGRDQAARVPVFDRSTYTTPSPQQLIAGGAIQQPKGFYAIPIPVDRDLEALLRQEPAIPGAVPAVFTPQESMKTLDQSLVNHIPGNRNVYIRGLHPTTDDELLLKYADRFGKVETSKAIIDTATGACKGFGFAKFFDVRDSEMCIRGFYRLGYEVGFARVRIPGDSCCAFHHHAARANMNQESFNSRLKAEGDEDSTNLYISNLPKSLTEAELGAIFLGYTILSSKILRDSMGNSRGVGFARFESRELCDEIIKEFTSVKLGDEGLPMQIRYADTPAQKELKRVTSERRQFRTNEYNVGAYGTPLVGLAPTIYSQPTFRRGASGADGYGARGPSFGNGRGHGRGGMGGGMGGRNPYDNLSPARAAAFPARSFSAAELSNIASGNAASSEDGSADEGVTIHVESPLVANGSTQSSPIKQEKD